MADHHERVQIWNSFFRLAWGEAKRVFELSNQCEGADSFKPDGGTLPEEEFHILAAVVLCNLAIEARANHLIEELIEAKTIKADVGRAARQLPTRHKWFLLPTLAGSTAQLDAASAPHQAIAQLCTLRNAALHVDYEKLHGRLPNADAMLSYFKHFVEAMEDMNVILKRGGRTGPLPDVLKLGEFTKKEGV